MLTKMTAMILPVWARWIAAAAGAACMFLFGAMQGERAAGERQLEAVRAQAMRTVKVAQAQFQVVQKTEIKYRDRIKTVYVQGEHIAKDVPMYVSAVDSARFGVNDGFVRLHDAAWAGEPAGAAVDSDREPAAVSLAQIAETDAYNATACRAWREQALGLRDFYAQLRAVTGTPDDALN